MDRLVLTPPTPPPLEPILMGNAAGPSFIAFAAQRPLKAVEKPIPEDNNQWHGIFTWNLLQGLRGAAANEFGIVTGKSLGDWLRHAQLPWLDEAERANPDLAKEPSIIDDDERLVLKRGAVPLELDVMLHWPPEVAVGQSGQLWSGQPPRPARTFNTNTAGTPLKLRPGFYLAEVPGARIRHGFTVVRAGDIVLCERGTATIVPTDNDDARPAFSLSVSPQDPTATIQLIGGRFRVIDSGPEPLVAKLPFGLYEIRTTVGRQISQKVLLLDSDWPKPGALATDEADAPPQLVMITSAAPLPGTRATHEYHRDAVIGSTQKLDVTKGEGAQLLVMARGFSTSGQAAPDAEPWNGVVVTDATGDVVANLSRDGTRRSGGDPLAVCMIAVPPGAISCNTRCGAQRLLRKASSCLRAAGAWRSTLCAGLMRRIGSPWGTVEDTDIEKARVALADERPIMSDHLSELLFRKYDNPLAKIIGGHLLLMGEEQGRRHIADSIDAVVTNLRTLVGPAHPDVEALSLACSNSPLRATQPFVAAPMFERSWRMMLKASQTTPQLVSADLWDRIYASISLPPFLSWSLDAQVKSELGLEFARAVFTGSKQNNTAPPNADIQPFRLDWPTAESLIAAAERSVTHSSVLKSARSRAFHGVWAPCRLRRSGTFFCCHSVTKKHSGSVPRTRVLQRKRD